MHAMLTSLAPASDRPYLILALFMLLSPCAGTAGPFDSGSGSRQNPFIAGMEAMLDAMGYQSKSASPFPDDDPFSAMPSMDSIGGSPWSGFSSFPGMTSMPGMSPFGTGGMPWSTPFGMGALSGMSPFGMGSQGIPGFGSPWEYMKPDKWGRSGPGFPGKDIRRYLGTTPPASPTRELDGLWIGKNGERLWIRNGWVRIYRDTHSDARALLRNRYLFIGIPETKNVLQFEYGLRGNMLGLRDTYGNVQLFRRYGGHPARR